MRSMTGLEPLATNTKHLARDPGFKAFVLLNLGSLGRHSCASLGLALLILFSAGSGRAQQFCNATSITIPTSGAASVYPSNVTVSGLTGSLSDVTVTLNNIQHGDATDLDILLVGPQGQKFIIMSDVGSSSSFSSARVITLSDFGASSLPSGSIPSGTYKPTNNSTGDTFPAPAPAAPYQNPAPAGAATFGSVFGNIDPNGVWSLYIVDDASGDTGSLSGGWCMNVSVPTTGPGAFDFASATAIVGEADGNAIVSVKRSGTGGIVSVDYATIAGGTATGGATCAGAADYRTTSGTLTWADGDHSTKTFAVPICADTVFDDNETVKVGLSNPTGGAALGTLVTSTITILDYPTVVVGIIPGAYSASDLAPKTITLSATRNISGTTASIDFTTGGGNATGGPACTAGVDYITKTGTLTFTADEFDTSFTVDVCSDSVLEPGGEYFNVSLVNPSPGTIAAVNAGVATIMVIDNVPQVLTINSTDDLVDGLCNAAHCSLREAALAGSAAPAIDDIRFDPTVFNVAKTISMDSLDGFMTLADATMTGPGADLLTVKAIDDRVFKTNGNVSITGMTFLGGGGFSGGITNTGALTLDRVVIRGSSIDFSQDNARGALENRGGQLTIRNSTVKQNVAQSDGGIANVGGTTNILNTTISNNTGSSRNGLGVYVLGGTVNITNTTISDNVSSGSSGQGGGVFNFGGTVNIAYSTITANSASSGPGLYNSSGSIMRVKGSIIAGNAVPSDVRGTFVSQGNNLIGATNSNFTTSFVNGVNGDKVGTDQAPINALLGPLTDNNGRSFTRVLMSGSPAIDAGNATDFPLTDQRGYARPFDGDGNGSALPDMGAVEVGSVTTAAGVSVSGRVMTAAGRGVRSAPVSMTDSNGVTRTVMTGPRGEYLFENVGIGGTYVVSVASGRFSFAPQVVQVFDNLTGVDFLEQR